MSTLLLLLWSCATPDKPVAEDPADTEPSVDTGASVPDPSTDPPAPDDTEPAAPYCGDGAIDPGEACDDGPANGATPCGCDIECGFSVGACDDGDACTEADTCDGAGACAATPLACDDGDACTTDTCDAGVCGHAGWDGAAASLYPMAMIRDPSTLDLQVVDTWTVLEGISLVEIQEVRYTSWESVDCELRPVRIEAYIATPNSLLGGPRDKPGLAAGHGLGAFADAAAASNPAAQLNAVAIAWSGPGQGQSEGTGSTPDHLFDTIESPADSWFWEHAVAGMRALTVLQTLPEVDPSKLVMTGYSGGAVATHLVNGVDDRLVAAVPISGTGYLDLAAETTPQPGWEVDMLAAMVPPRDVRSPEWQRWVLGLDPARYFPTAHAPVMLINGAQDQFFPLHSTARTFADLYARDPRSRLLSIINWDHGWFALFNNEQPVIDADRAFEYWMRHHLGLGAAWTEAPPQPALIDVVFGLCDNFPCAMAVVDLPNTGLRVSDARLHVSTDGLAYASVALHDGPLGWTGGLPFTDPATLNRGNAVWIAEFELQSGLFGPTIRVSSAPSLPPGWQPTILPIAGPLPL
jgi:dienelactone hydrolase